MLKTALVAMTVIGCDCDAKLCEFIRETPAQWATVAECEADLKVQVIRDSKLDYPLVSGICRPAVTEEPSVRTLIASAEETTDPTKTAAIDMTSTAATQADEPAFPRQLLNGGKAILYRTAGGYTVVKGTQGTAAGATAGAVRRSFAWVADKIPFGF